MIDASRRLVHAGLVNAHTHSHGNLGKGMGDRWSLELLLTAAPLYLTYKMYRTGRESQARQGAIILRTLNEHRLGKIHFARDRLHFLAR